GGWSVGRWRPTVSCRCWRSMTALTQVRRPGWRPSSSTAGPGATLVRTEGLGHRRVLRDPPVVARVAKFAAEQAAPALVTKSLRSASMDPPGQGGSHVEEIGPDGCGLGRPLDRLGGREP